MLCSSIFRATPVALNIDLAVFGRFG